MGPLITIRIYFKRDDGSVYDTIVRTVTSDEAVHLAEHYGSQQATVRMRAAKPGDLRRDRRRSWRVFGYHAA